MTDEVVNQSRYGALPLSYGAAISSRAGGIRTHNLRLVMHVLQSGSQPRSPCLGRKPIRQRKKGDLRGPLTPEVGKSTTPDEVVAETGRFS